MRRDLWLFNDVQEPRPHFRKTIERLFDKINEEKLTSDERYEELRKGLEKAGYREIDLISFNLKVRKDDDKLYLGYTGLTEKPASYFVLSEREKYMK
jgi:hypothetical protein